MRGVLAALVVCVAIGVFFRFDALDHLPGINGDEAELGVKSWLTLHGQSMQLRTSSGTIPDPISLGLSWIVHLVVDPSPWALRLPAAIVGVATILAAFLIARRRWGRDVGVLAAALTACLPPLVMYSRFLWEPSQSPLVCALWLFAAYSGSVLGFALAGTLAILVHPTNIFLLPMVALVMLMGTDWRARIRYWQGHRARFALGAALVIALVWVVASYVAARGGNPNVAQHRLTSPREWLTFAMSYSDVITGSASYRYIVGPLSDQAIVDYRLVYLILFVIPVAISLIRDRRQLGVEVMGLAGALALFYVMGGPYSISPATERYAMWMTMPHVFIASRAWGHLWRDRRVLAGALATAVCAAALLDVNVQYFARLRSSNSVTENTFKTADVEPKLQAVRFIADRVDPLRRTRVYTENWWTYWAIRYLSLRQSPRWEVTILNGRTDESFPAEFRLPEAAPGTRQIFYVGYTGWRFTGIVLKQAPGAIESGFGGYGNTTILSVFQEKK